MIINFKKLRSLREQKHLTQQEVANNSGFRRTTYVDWEKGKNEPALEDVLKICEALNINMSEITEDKKTISSLLKQASALGKINTEPDSKEAQRFMKMFDLVYKKDPQKAEKAIEKASKIFIDEI